MPDERAMADGVNLAYDPDEDPAASAGEAQAWKHGREVGRAEAAGRVEAALSDLVQAIEGEHRDGVPVTRSIRLNAMFRAAKAALDGAPYEPSEDQVARAAIALMSDAIRASISSPWDAVDAARAALRAAFSPGGSLSGTDRQQTGH